MIPSNQSWISNSNDGWCSSRLWYRSLWNSARLMLWLTQLARRPISIIPWYLKNNHSPWRFHVTYSRSCPLWSLLILKSDLYLLTDWRLVISLVLVSRTLSRFSKCFFINLLESSIVENTLFGSNPPRGWSFTLASVSPSPLSILDVLVN
jgi:hypothetical protein